MLLSKTEYKHSLRNKRRVNTFRTERIRLLDPYYEMLVEAILFDMDGTLIDSTPGVLEAWKTVVNDYALEEDHLELAHRMHGRPLFETLPEVAGLTDPQKIKEEILRIENIVINTGPNPLPGVKELLASLPPDRWTIVTSATTSSATRALTKCGIPLPPSGIVGADHPAIRRGKPAPDPYLAGALTLSVDPEKCLVIEDAVSGLKSGKAAGSTVLAVCTTSPREVLEASGVQLDYIVTDLSRITVTVPSGGLLEVAIDQS